MKCPECGYKEMVSKSVDETLTYKGKSLTLHAMKGDFCPKCKEGIWDRESYHRYTEAQAALVRSGQTEVSSDIKRIRSKLNLTQQELAEAFGVGKMAFSRYERGIINPPAPVIKLLKLIEKHPALLKEMASINTSNELGG